MTVLRSYEMQLVTMHKRRKRSDESTGQSEVPVMCGCHNAADRPVWLGMRRAVDLAFRSRSAQRVITHRAMADSAPSTSQAGPSPAGAMDFFMLLQKLKVAVPGVHVFMWGMGAHGCMQACGGSMAWCSRMSVVQLVLSPASGTLKVPHGCTCRPPSELGGCARACQGQRALQVRSTIALSSRPAMQHAAAAWLHAQERVLATYACPTQGSHQ